jgi:hypothetical protein
MILRGDLVAVGLWDVAFGLLVVPLVLGWMLGRVGRCRLGAPLTRFGHVVARVVVLVAFAGMSVLAFERGSIPWIALGLLLALLTLGSLIIGAVDVVLLVRALRELGASGESGKAK